MKMATTRLARTTFAALWLSIVAACGAPSGALVSPGPTSRFPAELQVERYAQAASRGEPVYRVDPGSTLVTLTVRRAGSLARLGHDHVIASRSVQGYVAPAQGNADLYVPLAELTVDEPALRAEAGFDTHPTASDIDGTRANMLDKVLQVEQFPHALVRVRGVPPPGTGAVTAPVSLTLHGTSRTLNLPLDLARTPDALSARGTLALRQTDFGITPFSILGGAIQVKDEVEVRFDVRAVRVKAGDQAALTP